MTTYQQQLTVALEKRLSVLVEDTANLNLQLCELQRLHDRVRQADRPAQAMEASAGTRSRAEPSSAADFLHHARQSRSGIAKRH
jgi:hypothetical protein